MKRTLPALLLIISITFLFYLFNAYLRDGIYFLSPIETDNLRIRNDNFGEGHFGADRKNGRTHKGLDILAPIGTPARASKGGLAIVKFDEDGYGNYVKIYHIGGLMTVYAHLKETDIKWLKMVRQGDIIGWVGKTGNARYRGIKPHIHFEVRKCGVAVDPLKGYLR